MAEDIRDILKQHEKAWDKTAAREAGFANLPRATYQFEVDVPGSGAFIAKDGDGAVRARFKLTVMVASDEALVGKVATKSYTLVQADGSFGELGVGILKGDLELMNVTYKGLAEAADAMQAACGSLVTGVVRLKEDKDGNEQMNIFFNKLDIPSGATAKGGKGKKAAY